MGDAEHTETFRSTVSGAETEIDRAQFQIQSNGLGVRAAVWELAEMILKDGSQLQTKVIASLDESIGLCGHKECQRLDGGGFCAISRHDTGVRREVCHLLGGSAHIEVVRVALTGYIRVRRQNHIRLEIADGLRQLVDQLLLFIESAVAEVQKADVCDAQHGGGCDGFLLAQRYQSIPADAFGGIAVAESAVQTDQKTDVLAHGGSVADFVAQTSFQRQQSGGESQPLKGQRIYCCGYYPHHLPHSWSN